MNRKYTLALVLFLLGFAGVLSTLLIEFPLSDEARGMLSDNFTDGQIKGLFLLNPTLVLVIAIIMGVNCYKDVNLPIPLFDAWIFKRKLPALYPLLIVGIGGGLFAGLLMTLCTLVFQPLVPDEFFLLYEDLNPPWVMRVLYGGITLEIIVRFGFMSFFVWLLYRLTNSLQPAVYWTGIVLASLLFGLLNVPVVHLLMNEPSNYFILYILMGNFFGGLVFGWLYWRRGLTIAILAHIVTQIVVWFAQI